EIDDDSQRHMFLETGILSDKINSVYMLKGMQQKMPGIFSAADKLLMIPDMLNYFFTGKMLNEPSEISTTQMFDTDKMQISREVCNKMGIPEEIFCSIGKHGTAIGNLLPALKEELDIDYDIPVICVPSHDTASAVLGTPAREKQFSFISSGTWALIGAECEKPIISDEVMAANLTNEVGAFGKITLLKNSIGMFIIQRLKKEYDEEKGSKCTWDEFNALAESGQGMPALFNVNDSAFFNPFRMSTSIWEYLKKSGQVGGKMNWNTIVSSVHNSMACSYAAALEDISRITGLDYGRVYIVGGGSRNASINRLCADITGWKVVACPMECTSIGNVAAQIKYFYPEYTYRQIKDIVADSLECVTFIPEKDRSSLLVSYKKLCADCASDIWGMSL
ncbi:MAG: FGGY-family carbohydrate kinase, partial [Clostridiaceae bacterium]|nr:FGGY-family carbohydrate kinase [Clostridiaceae bacterium]